MKPYRKEKVSSLVREIVSEAIAFKLSDPRVAALTTVTRVKMTPDLLFADVYLSVPGGEAAERLTLRAIEHAQGFLQRHLGDGLSMRQVPNLRFHIDDELKKTRHTLELLAENRRKNPGLFEPESDTEADDGAMDAPDGGPAINAADAGVEEPDDAEGRVG